jgi:hypothetical protein
MYTCFIESGNTERGGKGEHLLLSQLRRKEDKDPDKTTAKNFTHLSESYLYGMKIKKLTEEKGSSSSMRIWLITSLSRNPCFPARQEYTVLFRQRKYTVLFRQRSPPQSRQSVRLSIKLSKLAPPHPPASVAPLWFEGGVGFPSSIFSPNRDDF